MYCEFITLYSTDYQWASTHVKKWKSVLKNKPSKHGHWTETGFLTVSETLQTLQTPSLSSAFILFNLSAAFDTVHLYLLVPGTHAELRLWESEPGKAQLISYFANIPVFFIMCTAQSLASSVLPLHHMAWCVSHIHLCGQHPTAFNLPALWYKGWKAHLQFLATISG